MSMQGRIEELSHRHQKLDAQIVEETKRPASDSLALKYLKRQKLRIKEELATLTAN